MELSVIPFSPDTSLSNYTVHKVIDGALNGRYEYERFVIYLRVAMVS